MVEGTLLSSGSDDASNRRDDGTTCIDEGENNTSGLSPASVAHTLNNTDERLDTVWKNIERDFANNRRTSPPKSPLEVDDHALDEYNNIDTGDVIMNEGLTSSSSEDVSPLMAHSESDLTLQISNKTSSSLVPIPINSHAAADANDYDDSNHNQHITQQIVNNNSTNKHQSLLQKYRYFLQKNEMSIDILESIMERFVFYGYLFKHDHHNISTEMYYAIWNSIRWFNDVVLVGWGEGMGMTLGRKDEWLISSSSSQQQLGPTRKSLSEAILLKLNSIVPILRSVLTATTCLYPAMEAWSRRSIYTRSLGTSSLIDNNGEEASRRYHAARVSYRLERVKFVARLALLSISWWARQNRHRKNTNDTHENDGERMSPFMPSLLRRGGELDPYEQLVPLKDAEEESKVAQYVGRRTGRRSIARSSSVTSASSFPSSSQLSCTSPSSSSSVIAKFSTLVKWLISKLTSSKSSIIYVYAVGELLHILRPLYWSHAESSQWHQQFQQRFTKSSLKMSQKSSNLGSSYSYAIWKAWFISLLMDLVSDKLLQLSFDSGDEQYSNRRESGSGGRRHSNQYSVSSSAEQAKRDELNRRRSRHKLYLLRSPMYNAVTHPVATQLGRMLSMIPSFGLGQWGAEYILDMMSYWNENHFMLES